VATEHREHAQVRERSAEEAEQRARMAQQEAQRERAEANLHEERATATERGMADGQLTGDRGELTNAEVAERDDDSGRFSRERSDDPEPSRRN
jgi:hypothetical protein